MTSTANTGKRALTFRATDSLTRMPALTSAQLEHQCHQSNRLADDDGVNEPNEDVATCDDYSGIGPTSVWSCEAALHAESSLVALGLNAFHVPTNLSAWRFSTTPSNFSTTKDCCGDEWPSVTTRPVEGLRT